MAFINVKVADEIRKAIGKAVKDEGKTINAVVETALAKYLGVTVPEREAKARKAKAPKASKKNGTKAADDAKLEEKRRKDRERKAEKRRALKAVPMEHIA